MAAWISHVGRSWFQTLWTCEALSPRTKLGIQFSLCLTGTAGDLCTVSCAAGLHRANFTREQTLAVSDGHDHV